MCLTYRYWDILRNTTCPRYMRGKGGTQEIKGIFFIEHLPTPKQYYEVVTIGPILQMRKLISERIRSVSQLYRKCAKPAWTCISAPGGKAALIPEHQAPDMKASHIFRLLKHADSRLFVTKQNRAQEHCSRGVTAMSISGSLPIVIYTESSCWSQNTISQKPHHVMVVPLSSPKEECLAPWTDWLVTALIFQPTLWNLHSPSSSNNCARSNSCKKKKKFLTS